MSMSAFWDDLARDLEDPEFLREYVAESMRQAAREVQPDGDVEALADSIGGCFSNVMDLPEWMRAPALGRHMTPLVEIAARAVLASDWLAAHDAQVRREHGERIAQVIEARNIAGHGAGCLCIVCEAFAECALIARQEQGS